LLNRRIGLHGEDPQPIEQEISERIVLGPPNLGMHAHERVPEQGAGALGPPRGAFRVLHAREQRILPAPVTEPPDLPRRVVQGFQVGQVLRRRRLRTIGESTELLHPPALRAVAVQIQQGPGKRIALRFECVWTVGQTPQVGEGPLGTPNLALRAGMLAHFVGEGFGQGEALPLRRFRTLRQGPQFAENPRRAPRIAVADRIPVRRTQGLRELEALRFVGGGLATVRAKFIEQTLGHLVFAATARIPVGPGEGACQGVPRLRGRGFGAPQAPQLGEPFRRRGPAALAHGLPVGVGEGTRIVGHGVSG